MTALRFLQSKLYLESYIPPPPCQPSILYICLSKCGYICFFQGSAFAHSISPFRKKNPKGLKYWLITIGLSHIWLNVLSKKRKRGLYHVTVKSFLMKCYRSSSIINAVFLLLISSQSKRARKTLAN